MPPQSHMPTVLTDSNWCLLSYLDKVEPEEVSVSYTQRIIFAKGTSDE